jgi:uncharacterized protein YndB with AHSA1/START domain
MSKAIITPDQDAVICEVQIAAPPERVFQALTSNEELIRWWNGEGGPCQVKFWEMEPRLGGTWRCAISDPSVKVMPDGSRDFENHGEIVEFDPPHVLAYSWFADFHSIPSHRTLVRWELIPQGQGTLVKMTHSALKDLPGGTGYVNGWPGVMDWLKKFSEARGNQ